MCHEYSLQMSWRVCNLTSVNEHVYGGRCPRIHQARFLEEFLKQFVFEANSKDALVAFLDPGRRSTMEL